MRSFVAHRIGDVVDVPDELLASPDKEISAVNLEEFHKQLAY